MHGKVTNETMKWTIAVALIGYGVLIFLEAVGLSHHPQSYYLGIWWPALLIVYGVEWILGRRGKGDLLWPIASILLGAWFLLHNVGVISLAVFHPFDLVVALFLVYIGVSILKPRSIRLRWSFKKSSGNVNSGDPTAGDWQGWKENLKQSVKDTIGKAVHEDGFYVRYHPGEKRTFRVPSLGDLRYGDSPWLLQPIVLENLVGTLRVNLATATISDAEFPIVVNGGAGEVRIQVPEDLPVHVDIEVFAGEVRLFEQKVSGLSTRAVVWEDPEFDQAIRKVRIYIRLKFGEVRVTRMS